jgi:hypothetical protein
MINTLSKIQLIVSIVLRFGLTCALLFILGCGGGTRGTGVEGSAVPVASIYGIVVDENDVPIPNVEVSVIESGEVSQTNESGQFTIEVPRDLEVRVQFSSRGLSDDLIVRVPSNIASVNVVVRLHSQTGSVSLTSLSS